MQAVSLDKKSKGVESGLPIPICNGANQGACFEPENIGEAALAQKESEPCLDFDKPCVKENSYRNHNGVWKQGTMA